MDAFIYEEMAKQLKRLHPLWTEEVCQRKATELVDLVEATFGTRFSTTDQLYKMIWDNLVERFASSGDQGRDEFWLVLALLARFRRGDVPSLARVSTLKRIIPVTWEVYNLEALYTKITQMDKKGGRVDLFAYPEHLRDGLYSKIKNNPLGEVVRVQQVGPIPRLLARQVGSVFRRPNSFPVIVLFAHTNIIEIGEFLTYFEQQVEDEKPFTLPAFGVFEDPSVPV
jgi:hypothetical protein